MNDNVKRDNRRALPRFLLIILCSALCGGVLGFLSEHFSMPVLELLAAARRGLTGWAYLLQLGWVALIGLVSFALCSRAKRVCRQAGPDSDEALEQADLLLGRSLLAVSVGMIGSFAWFTASIMGEWVSPWNVLLTLVGFVLAMAVFTLLQKLCVDQLRRMNPEKRGSVLDLRFNKDWLDSCDEAERHIIYKSDY